jgi:hypothetical protein
VSLLNKAVEDILIFHQVEVTDRDGNTILRPSIVGVPAKATIQPAQQSGTSARRAEQDNEGYETEQNYRLRFSRRDNLTMDLEAEIQWLGVRWTVVGKAVRYNGSVRTRHIDYMIRRN